MTYNIGKELRLRRIYDESGLIFTTPMDHGYSIGPVGGIDNIQETTRAVFAGGTNSIIVHKGMVQAVKDALPANGKILIHVSGSTMRSNRPNVKILTSSVDSAISYGADGISCHVNIGCSGDDQMLSTLSALVEDCERTGFPLLAMMYVRNDDGQDDITPDALAHAARIAEEAGSDIVKIKTTRRGERFDEVVQGINIPVIIAGGVKYKSFEQFLRTIASCIQQGAKGVSIGRNIFQSDDPRKAMRMVKETAIKAFNEV